MARTFDPRYLFLVNRLQQRGIAFNLEESLTESYNPLRAALTGFFTVGELGALTYVVHAKAGDGHVDGFAQIRERRTCPEADVLFIAPALDGDADVDVWQHLLPYICQRTADRGIERLFARPPEGGEEVNLFSKAGFSVYAREDVFCLTENQRTEPGLSSDVSIRPYRSEDVVAVHQLYTAVTSRLVQQAENVPGQGRLCPHEVWPVTGDRRGYVLEKEGEAVGCLTVKPGRVGHWLYVLLHPKAYGYAVDLLAHSLTTLADVPPRPVHCGVREYQGGLRAVLEDIGFQHHLSRALMVRHNTIRVVDPVRALRPALDKRAEVTTPTVSQVNGQQATGTPEPIK